MCDSFPPYIVLSNYNIQLPVLARFSAIFQVVTQVKRNGAISCFRYKVGIMFVYATPAGFAADSPLERKKIRRASHSHGLLPAL